MKFLKSHTGAMVVTAVVIVISILFGSHRSLTAERREVEALFTAGADGSGYSIATDLEVCLDVTANLLTVGTRYLSAAELQGLEGSRNMLSDWHGIGSARTAYDRLMETAGEVLTKLEGVQLTDKDAVFVAGFRADLSAKADTIARDPYNQRVDEFNNEVLGRFPANVLKTVTFVRDAEGFQ